MSKSSTVAIPSIEPVSRRLTYQLALFLTAAVLLVLPLLYLSLVGVVSWATFYHITANAFLFEEGKGGILAYVAGAVTGVAIVFVLVTPIYIVFQMRDRARRSVSETEAPKLWGFVRAVARAVGATPPRKIELDCEVNAAAKLDHLFARSSTLIIGLALMRGLSAGQFAGVLAHEFGHFRQGLTRRISYVIHHVQTWLSVAAHHRGWIDHQLAAIAGSGGYVWVVASVVRGSLWLARAVLRVELAISRAIVQFMTRQMEFDADRYEARLAGSAAFERTMLRLPILDVSLRQQINELHVLADRYQLPDNLPELVHLGVEDMSEEERRSIEEWGMQHNTAMYDSHPCSRDRIASVQRESARGVFFDDRPAIEFLDSMDTLCREVSVMHYEQIGYDMKRFALCDWREQRAESERVRKANEARVRLLGDFFVGGLFMLRGKSVPTSSAPLEQSVAAFRDVAEAFDSSYQVDLTKQIQEALGQGSLDELSAERFRVVADEAGLLLAGRIDSFLEGRPEPEAERARGLLDALQRLGPVEERYDELFAHERAYVHLWEQDGVENDSEAMALLHSLDAKILRRTRELMDTIGPIPFPPHDAPGRTLEEELELPELRAALGSSTVAVAQRVLHLTQWANTKLMTELAYDLEALGADWDLRQDPPRGEEAG